MKKLTLAAMAALVISAPLSAQAAEPLLMRVAKATIFLPQIAVVELVGGTVKNVQERDGWNLPGAFGRGICNTLGRVTGSVANVFQGDAYQVAIMENNMLANNNIAANVVGYGTTGLILGATGAINPTINGGSPEFAGALWGTGLGAVVGTTTQ